MNNRKPLPEGIHLTYRQEWRTCGRDWCLCKHGHLHGPYWYAYGYVNGNLKSFYIGKERTPNGHHTQP